MYTMDRQPSSPGDFAGGYRGFTTIDAVTPGFAASVAAVQASGVNPAQVRAEFGANFPNLTLGDWALGFGVLIVGAIVLREVL